MFPMKMQQLGATHAVTPRESAASPLHTLFFFHRSEAVMKGGFQPFNCDGLHFTVNADADWDTFYAEYLLVLDNQKVRSRPDLDKQFTIAAPGVKLAKAA